ncbi:MAG: VCBS repeat-containing protein [Myxococcota bacterium]|nr:VCBS repeat-containing protein [Myxococcota bacterium]
MAAQYDSTRKQSWTGARANQNRKGPTLTDIRRRVQRSISVFVLVLSYTGCGQVQDLAKPKADHHRDQAVSLEVESKALYGRLTFDDTACDGPQETHIVQAWRMGKVAALTNEFETCLRAAVRARYIDCSGDHTPTFEGALHSARSENDIDVQCRNLDGELGRTADLIAGWFYGPYHHQVEDFTIDKGYLNANIARETNGGEGLAPIARTIWHEVMHTHGFYHDESCGNRSDYHFQVNTMPYIVGACMENTVPNVVRDAINRVGVHLSLIDQRLLRDRIKRGLVDTPSRLEHEIRVLAGRGGDAFRGAISSFRGTLDVANQDGVGHEILGAADINGDGQADLVSVHTNGNAYVWPGRTSGTFANARASFHGTMRIEAHHGAGHRIVGLADVTGDGKADLVSVHPAGTAYVWRGRENWTFGHAIESFQGTLDLRGDDDVGHEIIGVADVNGDGRADLISSHTSGFAFVWRGRRDGRFSQATPSFNGSLNLADDDGQGHRLLGLADVTGDGRADLVSAHTSGAAFVWPGRADYRFGIARQSLAGDMRLASVDGDGHFIVALADVTGDGQADLVSAHTDGIAHVWHGRSNGRFRGGQSTFGGTLNFGNLDDTGHILIDVSDVDGDGKADLVSAHPNGHAYVWRAR